MTPRLTERSVRQRRISLWLKRKFVAECDPALRCTAVADATTVHLT